MISLEESALFTNHVQNLSQSTKRDVEIVEEVPAGFRVVNVEDGGVYDQKAGTITWTLAELPPGKTVELGVRLQAESTGELQSRVKGSTSDGDAVPIRARVRVEQNIPRANCSRIAPPLPVLLRTLPLPVTSPAPSRMLLTPGLRCTSSAVLSLADD